MKTVILRMTFLTSFISSLAMASAPVNLYSTDQVGVRIDYTIRNEGPAVVAESVRTVVRLPREMSAKQVRVVLLNRNKTRVPAAAGLENRQEITLYHIEDSFFVGQFRLPVLVRVDHSQNQESYFQDISVNVDDRWLINPRTGNNSFPAEFQP